MAFGQPEQLLVSEPNESEFDDSDVSVWLDKLKGGTNTDAIEKIWHRYYGQLIGYARKKLGTVPRRDFDEEDIVTDALDEFFNDVRRDRFPQLEDRDDLWRILLVLTLRKVLQNIRSNKAAKRGGGQVRGDSVFFSPSGNTGFDNLSAPQLDFVEELTLEMHDQLDSLGEETLKQVGVLKLQGYTNEEVAAKLEVSERTVERKLERIREIWKKTLTSSRK